jgi:hypothetical protein
VAESREALQAQSAHRRAESQGTTIDQVYRKGAAASAAVRSKKAQEHKARMFKTVKRSRENGMTLQAVADEMNQLGLKSPRGNQWHPTTVARILADDA